MQRDWRRQRKGRQRHLDEMAELLVLMLALLLLLMAPSVFVVLDWLVIGVL